MFDKQFGQEGHSLEHCSQLWPGLWLNLLLDVKCSKQQTPFPLDKSLNSQKSTAGLSTQYSDIDTTAKFKSSPRFLVLIPRVMSMNILVGILFFSISLWFIGLWSLCWMGAWIRIPLNICRPLHLRFRSQNPPLFPCLKSVGSHIFSLPS